MIDPIELVVSILSDEMEVPVNTERPPDRPLRFVQVFLGGDQSDEFFLAPRIDLLCWGATDKEAHGIARSAVDALQMASLDHPYLSSVRLESMGRDEWTKTGQARYLAEVDLFINRDE